MFQRVSAAYDQENTLLRLIILMPRLSQQVVSQEHTVKRPNRQEVTFYFENALDNKIGPSMKALMLSPLTGDQEIIIITDCLILIHFPCHSLRFPLMSPSLCAEILNFLPVESGGLGIIKTTNS